MEQIREEQPISGRYFLASLAIHVLFVGAVFFFGNHYVRNETPIPVVLTLELGGGGGGAGRADKLVKAPVPAVRRAAHRIKPVRRPVQTVRAPSRDIVTQVTPPDEVSERVPVVATAEPESTPEALSGPLVEGGSVGYGSGVGTGQGAGIGSGIGTGSGAGFGSGAGSGIGSSEGPGKGFGINAEMLRERYRREHFAYIRDLILEHLEYPAMARRMGWHGALAVSFVVQETGRAEKIRIVKSSGYEILDRNVAQTIREVQPFPKPPVKAELIIPVLYSLE